MIIESDIYEPTQRELTDSTYIRFINANMARHIAINRRPKGLFVQRRSGKYVGIRNQTGAIWKKEFENKMSCLDWLTENCQWQTGAIEVGREIGYGKLV